VLPVYRIVRSPAAWENEKKFRYSKPVQSRQMRCLILF
jgi:hypothetical protein